MQMSQGPNPSIPWQPLWLMEPVALQAFALDMGSQPAHAEPEQGKPVSFFSFRPPRPQITLTEGGTAIIPLHGVMMKEGSWWRDSPSTVAVAAAVDEAGAARDVERIVVHVDTPGGEVAYVDELASTIERVNTVKPVTAYIEDLGASAGYYAASQAGRIVTNAAAEVGSISTMIMLLDSSERLQREGFNVEIFTPAAFKGIGMPGQKLTEDQRGYLQERVRDINELFLGAVARGRGLNAAQIEQVSDGRVFIASKAKELGLIDDIQSFPALLQSIEKSNGLGGRNGTMNAKDILAGIKALVSSEAEPEVTVIAKPDPTATEDYQTGLALGKTQGHAEGKEKGYEDGVVAGKSAGYTAGIEAGLATGRIEGYDTGYAVAKEIANLAQVAEMPEEIHKFLAHSMTLDTARGAIETIRSTVSDREGVVSAVLPGPSATAPAEINTKGIYETRQRFQATGEWKI